MQSNRLKAIVFLLFMCGSLLSCTNDAGKQPAHPIELRLYSYGGSLDVSECGEAPPVASLGFSEGGSLYLNVVSTEVLQDQIGIDLYPFGKYYGILMGSEASCFDKVEHEMSVAHQFSGIDQVFKTHIFSAIGCGHQGVRQYVLLPDGRVVAPVEASYDFLLSQCVLGSKINFIEP
jgi:hypothetical protein